MAPATAVFPAAKSRAETTSPGEVRKHRRVDVPAERPAPDVREYLREHIVLGYN